MVPEDFPLIEAALQAVVQFAGRLPAGDEEAHVSRTVDELRAAFMARAAIEPAVDRLARSLRGLQAARAAGSRRHFLRGSSSVDRLLHAVDDELLPALRRVGFRV
jgi:hypothetical protein